MTQAQQRETRAAGALVGSAVGDALGAPFEFGPAGDFSQRFPRGGGAQEMCGGRGWAPGEGTDDTQMALMVADSLLAQGGLDESDVFERFKRWAHAGPKDIGLQTRAVLDSGLPWDRSATDFSARNRHSAGNGSLMRCATSAVYFAPLGRAATMDAARRLSALTHGDHAAGEGCAVLHELVRVALDGRDPLAALDDTLALVHAEHRDRWAVVLAPDWHPGLATEPNGAVWPTLGSAVWALRTTGSFEDGLRAAVDQGWDTDTVACVTGILLGAVHGLDAVPARWREPLHVPLPGWPDAPRRDADLVALAATLLTSATP
ncbi:ADP-ribosylglycohydrolase family protein [Streptacidiphilus sp. EB129]|uniref:ADP-ribosylglycohydrolase family protein n=1 Tax=Streptacidiphilus sp. EB129 TaxID=3156262 RepID=UPI003510D974